MKNYANFSHALIWRKKPAAAINSNQNSNQNEGNKCIGN